VERTLRSVKTERTLPEEQRRAIFLALVDAQDQGASVLNSRKAIAEHFAIRDNQVRQIEDEGLDNEWPPLGS
jgi:hypothetical protein